MNDRLTRHRVQMVELAMDLQVVADDIKRAAREICAALELDKSRRVA